MLKKKKSLHEDKCTSFPCKPQSRNYYELYTGFLYTGHIKHNTVMVGYD